MIKGRCSHRMLQVSMILTTGQVSPVLGMICGSGLGSLAGLVTDPVSLPYNTIPNFPVSTAPGHQGRLVIGKLSGVPVVIMQVRNIQVSKIH